MGFKASLFVLLPPLAAFLCKETRAATLEVVDAFLIDDDDDDDVAMMDTQWFFGGYPNAFSVSLWTTLLRRTPC